MPLLLDDFNGMELMWNELKDKPDPNHVKLVPFDLENMWECGIVDTKLHPLKEWIAAFDNHKQPDGTYLLTKTEFMAKEDFRYKGEIMIPFDAMKINEGKYTDEGLNELFHDSVVPSCNLAEKDVDKFLENLKNKFRDPESRLVKIGKDAKLMIRELVDKNPSPLRKLELLFDYLITKAMPPEQTYTVDNLPAIQGQLSPKQIAQIQASSFSMQPANTVEEKWQALSKLEKKKKKKSATPVLKSEKDKGVTLKKVKRSRKGIRG